MRHAGTKSGYTAKALNPGGLKPAAYAEPAKHFRREAWLNKMSATCPKEAPGLLTPRSQPRPLS